MLRKAGISGRSLDLVFRDDSFTEQILWGSVLQHMLEVRDAHTAPQVTWEEILACLTQTIRQLDEFL